MKRIGDYAGILEDSADVMLRLLNEWQPQTNGRSERAYERQLLAWFKKKLPEVPMLAQYGIANGTADIVIEDSHLIELKLAFKAGASGEFKRCLGQLEMYKRNWAEARTGTIYLVIMGQSDVAFRDMLQKGSKMMPRCD